MHVFKYSLGHFCVILTKNCNVPTNLKTFPNVKFNENWFHGSAIVTYGPIDAQIVMRNSSINTFTNFTLERAKQTRGYILVCILYFIINDSG
jgi:hypothetical protein